MGGRDGRVNIKACWRVGEDVCVRGGRACVCERVCNSRSNLNMVNDFLGIVDHHFLHMMHCLC